MAKISKEVIAKVGTVLRQQGIISSQVLQEASSGSSAAGKGMLDYLLEKNSITENDITNAISKSYNLQPTEFNPKMIQVAAASLIPGDVVKREEIVPFSILNDELHIAVADPLKVGTIGPRLKQFHRNGIKFFVTRPSLVDEAIKEDIFDEEKRKTIKENQNDEPKKNNNNGQGYNQQNERLSAKAASGVVEFVDYMLNHALVSDTSDIHIEPFRDEKCRVRFRINGVLETQEMYTKYLLANYQAVVTRLKIMSQCSIQEKRLPQDGVLQFKDKRNPKSDWIDVRFSTLPAKYGERIVMRLLKGSPELALDKIGFLKEDLEKLNKAINSPQGMVLVTGPTGSGKSTTLYAALQTINSPGKSILTAEDPVEYYLEGLGQVQANDQIGLTFSSILRSFLRQDPEVILVGEIRDKETVEIAIKAALTGHLLLSTLHTNDAISTVVRLLNMGVPSFMVSSALTLIVAQRLARKVCQDCKIIDTNVKPQHLETAGFDKAEALTIKPHIGKGCDKCKGTGYKGRQGIYEVLENTTELATGILNNAQAPELLEIAKKSGFITMSETGKNYLKNGILSMEEYQRVLIS